VTIVKIAFADCVKIVPMAFVEEIQQQSFWDRKIKTKEPWTLLQIPRTGPVSHLIRGTMPPSFHEWLLQKTELSGDSTVSPPVPQLQAESFDWRPTKQRKFDDDQVQSSPKITHGTAQPRRTTMQLRIDGAPRQQDMEKLRLEAYKEHVADQASAMAEARRQENARNYVEPDAGQSDVHKYFHYSSSGSDKSASDTPSDPAMKPPEKLTKADKWILCEELAMITASIEPEEFLKKRFNNTLTMVANFHPDNQYSWTQFELDTLKRYRQQVGGMRYQIRRQAEKADRENQNRLHRIWQEMEEFVVRSGLSRIDFLRARESGSTLPLGLSPETWDDHDRKHLLILRESHAFKKRPEHVSALLKGEVKPQAQGAAMAPATAAAAASNQSQLPEDKTMNKITDYFAPGPIWPTETEPVAKQPDALAVPTTGL
jgi:hypothetical protein